MQKQNLKSQFEFEKFIFIDTYVCKIIAIMEASQLPLFHTIFAVSAGFSARETGKE